MYKKLIPILLCAVLVLGAMDFPALTQADTSKDEQIAYVQQLVNELPDMVDINDENRDAVIAKLEAIDEAKRPFEDEDNAKIDYYKYEAAAFVLSAPPNMVPFALSKVYLNAAGDNPDPTFSFVDEAGVQTTLFFDNAGMVSDSEVDVMANGQAKFFYAAPGTYTINEEVAGDWSVSMTVNGVADNDMTHEFEAGKVYIVNIENKETPQLYLAETGDGLNERKTSLDLECKMIKGIDRKTVHVENPNNYDIEIEIESQYFDFYDGEDLVEKLTIDGKQKTELSFVPKSNVPGSKVSYSDEITFKGKVIDDKIETNLVEDAIIYANVEVIDATIEADPKTLDFGKKVKGYTATDADQQTVMITNKGSHDVSIEADSDAFEINPWTAEIKAGTTGEFSVKPIGENITTDISETIQFKTGYGTTETVTAKLTVEDPTYNLINSNNKADLDFGELLRGYTDTHVDSLEGKKQEVVIKNNGNQPVYIDFIPPTGFSVDLKEVTDNPIEDLCIESGAEKTLVVKPDPDLRVGTYSNSFVVTAAKEVGGKELPNVGVTVTAKVKVVNPTEKRVQVDKIDALPYEVYAKYSTFDAFKEEMLGTVLPTRGYSKENAEYYLAREQYNVYGTWIDANDIDIPQKNVAVFFKYPAGTSAATHDFAAAHMTLTEGTTNMMIKVDYPEKIVKGADGVTVTFDTLSPVALYWKPIVSPDEGDPTDSTVPDGTPDGDTEGDKPDGDEDGTPDGDAEGDKPDGDEDGTPAGDGKDNPTDKDNNQKDSDKEDDKRGVDTGDHSAFALWIVTALTAMAAFITSFFAWRRETES